MDAVSSHYGTWHCARPDIVQEVVAALWQATEQPSAWEPSLPLEQAQHNAYVSLAAVALGLLNGIRPAEILRTRRWHFDRDNLFLAIAGKSHARLPGYRRVPLLPKTASILSVCFDIPDEKIRNDAKSTRLFCLFHDDGQLTRGTSVDLDNILVKAGRAGLDFYSLRHRYRTDMLALGVPERQLNHLMGHESRGVRAFSIYLDDAFATLVTNYQTAACQLAQRYGIIRG